MSSRHFGARTMLSLGLVVAVTACDRPAPNAQQQADSQTRTACERRAEQAYDQQNRAEIFSPPLQVNTPYSGNYISDRTDRGLSELFVHDRMVSDCVRNTGTGSERSPAAVSAQLPVPRPSGALPLPLPPPPPPRR